jgi:hypothetical protein
MRFYCQSMPCTFSFNYPNGAGELGMAMHLTSDLCHPN